MALAYICRRADYRRYWRIIFYYSALTGRDKMKNFFNHPFELSFKDILAIAFSGIFLYFCWNALGNKDALAVVQTLVPLIGIILGGYFVQESAAMWFMRSQGMQQPYYGGYYNYSPYPPVISTSENSNTTQDDSKPTI